MAYKYHTQLLTSFFNKFIEMLSVDGTNKVCLYSSSGIKLAECNIPNANFVKNIDDKTLQLIASDTTLSLEDGTASKGKLFNGNNDLVVEFDVGSSTVNPTAELILNSVVIYKGGSVTITDFTLTV